MEGQDLFFSKNDIKSAKRKMEELKNSRCSLGLTVFWIVGKRWMEEGMKESGATYEVYCCPCTGCA